jgi:hypothetical protein
MRKKTLKCVCHECVVDFDIVIVANESNKKLVPDICPFCGDVCDLRDERTFSKFFDEDENFDYEKYYDTDEDFDDEDE